MKIIGKAVNEFFFFFFEDLNVIFLSHSLTFFGFLQLPQLFLLKYLEMHAQIFWMYLRKFLVISKLDVKTFELCK